MASPPAHDAHLSLAGPSRLARDPLVGDGGAWGLAAARLRFIAERAGSRIAEIDATHAVPAPQAQAATAP
ncbi:hypothetical protein ACIO6T_20230 [Streptomyces sp. NPDC087532]|uniref:hypothetical protein n=1 Tax=Streptomyces sp. NPDC087532 TaxID=3365795 RepID=UPI00381D8F3C